MSILTTGIQLTKNIFTMIWILLFSFFSWYFFFSFYTLQNLVGPSAENYLMINALFNFTMAATSVVSSFLIHKIHKTRILYGYSISASILTIILLFTSNIILRLIIIFVVGILFSVGMLAFFTYFWDLTTPVERGRTAGLAGFFALPIAYIVGGMAETFDFAGTVMFGVVLSLGVMTVKLLRPEKKKAFTRKKDEKGKHPEKRTIFLYAVPWAIFCLVNASLAKNISSHILQRVPFPFYTLLIVLQLFAAVFGALSGGIIADFFGRRPCLVASLTLYGIGSALVGLIGNFEMLYFVYIVSGLNWGILLTLYLFVVWGDLANEENCSRVYSIGLIIFYCTTGAGFLLEQQMTQIPLIISSLTTCLLIFLSNIPLLFAPELLSLDFREKIKLKLHFKAIKKIRRKTSRN